MSNLELKENKENKDFRFKNIPHFEFLTGAAGTGKTTELNNRITKSYELINRGIKGARKYATLTATTGIAAINLASKQDNGDQVSTINSKLGFFDTKDMQTKYANGKLIKKLKNISREGKRLAIDEISMFGEEKFTLLVDALIKVNDLKEVQSRGGLGLVVVGDFCQLPPVKEEFCFTSKYWKNIKVTKLEKVWRQDDPIFLDAVNFARKGDGENLVEKLKELGRRIRWRGEVDIYFDGTTLVAVNKQVEDFNKIRLDELIRKGKKEFSFESKRWGKQLGEWKLIPEERLVCEDCYVMILVNDSPEFTYANGSCGYVVGGKTDSKGVDSGLNVVKRNFVEIKLKENGNVVRIGEVTRKNFVGEDIYGEFGHIEVEKVLSFKDWLRFSKDGGIDLDSMDSMDSLESEENSTENNDIYDDSDFGDNEKGYKLYLRGKTFEHRKRSRDGWNSVYWDYEEEKWVIGEVTYIPINIAYATTVHKSQGLTLDNVQIDYSHSFFGEPSMSYVALSRVKSPEGLVIVGNEGIVEMRTNVAEEILEWI